MSPVLFCFFYGIDGVLAFPVRVIDLPPWLHRIESWFGILLFLQVPGL
jgi:hypothetical protein